MENVNNFKELLNMLWGDTTQIPEELLYEQKVEERKKHLKPCPLCGCPEPVIQEENIENCFKLYRVVCPKCAITSFQKSFTIIDAMDVWDSLGEKKDGN